MSLSAPYSPAASKNSESHERDRAWPVAADLAAIAAAVLIVFGPAVRFDFVRWDDPAMVAANPWLSPPTAAHLAHLWTHAYYGLYAPLTYSVYAGLAYLSAQVRLPESSVGFGAMSPLLFHASSVALHLACTVCVYAILRRLGAGRSAGFGALLFALAPVQVESVCWIGSLDTLLSSLLALLAIGSYLSLPTTNERLHGRVRWAIYALASLCYALALLSKPSAVATPIIACCLAIGLQKRPAARVTAEMLPWFAAAAGWVVLTKSVQTVSPHAICPLWARPLVAADALVFYLGRLAAPTASSPDFGRSPQWLIHHKALWTSSAVPALAAIAVRRLHTKAPYLAACSLVFVAALLPVLGFVPFAFQRESTVADRYLYLALLGPACAASLALKSAGPSVRRVCAVAIAGLAALSAVAVPAWRDSYSLFARAASACPQVALMRYDLAETLSRRGEENSAAREYRAAIALDPDDSRARCNLAGLLAEAGRTNQAQLQYELALHSDPTLWEAHDGLGLVYAERGDRTAAQIQWRDALRDRPNDAFAAGNLAIALRADRRRIARASPRPRRISAQRGI